ncbi:Long-chain-fatty-acid--CoA ligase [Delftia tsuruhatensis]|uniref:AMP-binding protein n=1 Tax=Delftia tsuruhatensis TaxID=180282 RepID=UPI001E73FE1B|nr:AMP-binding protein [Delftia tsuruhatensis]CAB5704043.1 Long-chain-fatty-acid--CoA ligase [Delftia tsuruhatensis]CAC9684235.1 Long-chain-fatty-acid--CoA ligase [Delftia tsuruhatensis]
MALTQPMPQSMFRPLRAVRSLADVEAIESRPMAELVTASSVHDIFRNSAREHGQGRALSFLPRADSVDDAVHLSYAELLCRIHQTANALHALGMGPDDAVAILLPGCAEYHFALWGGEVAGIVQPVNPLLSVEKISALIRTTGARFLIAWADEDDAGIRDKVAALDADFTHVLWVSHEGNAPRMQGLRWPCGDLHAAMAAQPGDRLVSGRQVRPGDVAAFFHTGGTTGAPKIAVQTHGAQVYTAWASVQMQGLNTDDRTINGYPLFHVAGVLPGSLACFSAGAQVIIPTTGLFRNKAVIAAFWRLVAQWRPTLMSAVPTVLAALAEVPLDGADVSSIRYFRTGAAPLSPEVAARFKAHSGFHVHESLGMTEMTGISTITPPGLHAAAGHVGLRLPFARLAVRRMGPDGRPTPEQAAPGETGMVLFRSPNLFSGYLGGVERGGYLTEDGWLITGDLGSVGADGLLRLRGRSKDVIIRSGHNIDPQVIEQALERHPAVKACAAVGAPDPYAGEVPVAFVALHPGARADEASLLAFASAGVDEAPARPRYVRILDALPTTNVGKVYKPRMRSMACEAYARTLVEQIHGRRGLDLAPGAGATHTEGEGFVLRTGSTHADRRPWMELAQALSFIGEPVRIDDGI